MHPAPYTSEHMNRRDTSVSAAFSPCMRYIACGSEDRSTYIYDRRTGTSCARLQVHADVAPAVAFNPLHPQLVSGSYDGSLHFFSCDSND